MIYSVVPRELESSLLAKLTAHYAEQPDVTVLVDRRESERRTGSAPPEGAVLAQRVIRDRRRRRATGEIPALRGE
jgi:hypothetical protein